MEENWKQVPNYEEYVVSDLGRVKSLKNNSKKNQILRTSVDRKGYHRVFLYNKNRRKCLKVSMVVAMAFLNHEPSGKHSIVVDHIDNDKSNNSLSNLQLITNRENCSKDRIRKTSRYTGVFWNGSLKLWTSSIGYKGKNYILGNSKDEDLVYSYYLKALSDIEVGIEPSYNKRRNYKKKEAS
jgi:hypothetical protein